LLRRENSDAVYRNWSGKKRQWMGITNLRHYWQKALTKIREKAK
jgi:hypothetical protein